MRNCMVLVLKIDAAHQNFLLQAVGHLEKRRAQEPHLCVGNALEKHFLSPEMSIRMSNPII